MLSFFHGAIRPTSSLQLLLKRRGPNRHLHTMPSFLLKLFSPPVPVNIPEHLKHVISEQQLVEWPHFHNWAKTLEGSLALQEMDSHAFNKAPYYLKKVDILSVSMFGSRIGFVKLNASVVNITDEKDALPGISFLRGSAVAMLMILRPKDSGNKTEKWVVMTEQARIPIGSLAFTEIPAGMMDQQTGEIIGQAVKEIQEETGLVVPPNELINLTELALEDVKSDEGLKDGMYPSPGGSDEFISILLWEKELDRQEIESLRGKLTGNRNEHEKITVRLVKYEDLWKVGARDAKTLGAWALYEALKKTKHPKLINSTASSSSGTRI